VTDFVGTLTDQIPAKTPVTASPSTRTALAKASQLRTRLPETLM
jgi:hypothetical protein